MLFFCFFCFFHSFSRPSTLRFLFLFPCRLPPPNTSPSLFLSLTCRGARRQVSLILIINAIQTVPPYR